MIRKSAANYFDDPARICNAALPSNDIRAFTYYCPQEAAAPTIAATVVWSVSAQVSKLARRRRTTS